MDFRCLTYVAWTSLGLVCTGLIGCAGESSSNNSKARTVQHQPASISTNRPAPPPSTVTFHTPPKPLSPEAKTQDWPSFLGPLRNAVSEETRLLKHWPKGGPTLVWEMVTGSGFAGPVMQGDKLIYFHRVGDEEIIECLHAETGRRFWKYGYPTRYRDRYEFSNGPRTTPIIDGDRVYTYGAEGKLHCLDLMNGSLRWKHDTTTEYKVPQDFFGVGSSPLMVHNLLVVNVGAPDGPCVAAYDKLSGDVVWKAGDVWRAGYASPVMAEVNSSPRVLVFTGGDNDPPTGGLLSIRPKDGAIDFRFPFRSKTYISVNAATPVVVAHEVFLTSAYRTGGVLIALQSNDHPKVIWHTNDLRSHFSTPVYKDGYLYGFDGSGKGDTDLVCLDWKTGKLMWRHHPTWEEPGSDQNQTRKDKTGLYRGTLLAVDGHFLALGEEGHLLWLDLTPKGYKELNRTRLFAASESWTPLTISRGLLYVTQNSPDQSHKTPTRLLCYDLRGY